MESSAFVQWVKNEQLGALPLRSTLPSWRVSVGDVLKAGGNQLEIDVVNLLRNRLVGDAAQPVAERVTRTTIVAAPTEPLLPSGLLGPVRLVRPEVVP